MDKIRKIKFPELLLYKQDKSNKYGYHWAETTNSKGRRTQVCVLLKEELYRGIGYYLPLNAPYELCREDNYPRENSGHYIVQSSEPEYRGLMETLPYDVFMPTLEYCNSVSPKEWFDVFITVCTEFPEMIDNIAMFSFMVSSENKLYDGYYLICYPFVNFTKDENNEIIYRNNNSWLVKDTSNIRIDGNYVNHIGNVFFYKKEYVEEWFGRKLLPIIMI